MIAETGTTDHLLIGSANCTNAALGTGSTAGSNKEVSLYRRLPPSNVFTTLGLETLLKDDKQIQPDDLPPLNREEDIPLGALEIRYPRTFSQRGDMLIWRPLTHIKALEDCVIDLLKPLGYLQFQGLDQTRALSMELKS